MIPMVMVSTISSPCTQARAAKAMVAPGCIWGGKLSETGWSPIEEIGSVRFVASAGDLDGDGLMDTVWGVGARGQEQTSSVRFGSAQGTAIVERNFNFGTPDKVGGQSRLLGVERNM